MKVACTVLALCALALSLPTRADDEDDRWSGRFPGRPIPGFADYWYVNGKGGIVVTDQEFDNDGTLYGLTVGRTWGSRYAFELELATDELDFGIDYGLKHRSIGINHLTINREPLWDPYFLIGVGVLEFDGPEGLEDRTGRDFMFNVGVGGEWELVVPRKVLLRADLRLRYGLNDNNQPGQNEFGDGIFTVGLTVPFGDSGAQR
jgi:hypothetical protein